jgi:hypothetical protein
LKRLSVYCGRCSIHFGVDSGCEYFVGGSLEEVITLLIFEELVELEEQFVKFLMKDLSSNIYTVEKEKQKNLNINNPLKLFF